VNGGDVEVFTPSEIARLLDAAKETSPDFLPCIAIGAFAGLRSAEIERLEWSDINLAERFIVVGADKAKTAARRIVPIADNLAAWLAPYAERRGKVWLHDSDSFYKQQAAVATATAVEADVKKNIPAQKAVEWKANGLRHSFASYSFALTHDAGRIAGYLGNSAAVVHRHYRELVTPTNAMKWFSITPEGAPGVRPEIPASVPPMLTAATNA
jgi:integrase